MNEVEHQLAAGVSPHRAAVGKGAGTPNAEVLTASSELRAPRPAQRPGCLPVGFSAESWLSIEQFCVWKGGRSRKWFATNRRKIPGVYGTQVHVGAHLRGVFPGLSKHF